MSTISVRTVVAAGSLCCWICLVNLLLAACAPIRATSGALPGVTPTVDRWDEFRQWMPYPYTTPLPPAETTPLDGVYVRFDPRQDERPPCRRCPPYPPEGGVWKLQLEQGVFRVYHPATGWRTLGSFMLQGDHMTLFNDPQCHLAIGRFAWQLEQGELRFHLLGDDCELGTRARNFTQQPWRSCQPPNHEAAISGHWKAPEGCEM